MKERDEAVAKMKAVKAFLSKFEIREATERALNPASFSVATGSRGGKVRFDEEQSDGWAEGWNEATVRAISNFPLASHRRTSSWPWARLERPARTSGLPLTVLALMTPIPTPPPISEFKCLRSLPTNKNSFTRGCTSGFKAT